MTADEARRRAAVKNELLVKPGDPAGLDRRSTTWTGDGEFEPLSRHELDARAKEILAAGIGQLADAQELLYACNTYSILVVFQAMDAAGKDSTIKHVMTGVNPQGVWVHSFKKPSSEELDHSFLWRIAKAAPESGRIGIFNRSQYEEVIALKVHPEWLDAQRLPSGERNGAFWQTRYDDLNSFEQHLDRTGTKIVKFFLHVSKAEQKRRFLARLDEQTHVWKFNADDITERQYWDDYMQAYEDAITATATPWAPWFVIPADHKPVMQAMVVSVLVDTITSLDLQWPTVSDADREANVIARTALEAEPG